jgi:hypothetical protein
MTFLLYIYIIYIIRVRVYGTAGFYHRPYFKKRILESFFFPPRNCHMSYTYIIYIMDSRKVLEKPLKTCLRHGRPFKADIYNYHIGVVSPIFLLSFLFIIYNIYNNNNTERRVHPCFRKPVINIFKCFFGKKES